MLCHVGDQSDSIPPHPPPPFLGGRHFLIFLFFLWVTGELSIQPSILAKAHLVITLATAGRPNTNLLTVGNGPEPNAGSSKRQGLKQRLSNRYISRSSSSSRDHTFFEAMANCAENERLTVRPDHLLWQSALCTSTRATRTSDS